MGVDMSNNPPNSQFPKDFFSSPALSLSLAGIFRGAEDATAKAKSTEVEEGEEGSGGGRREDTVEISSENSGPARSRSEDDFMINANDDDDDDDDGGGGDDKGKKKKRKKYHRHTTEQIREMEAAFGYGFLPFSFSSLGELEKDAVALLKRVQAFARTQDIGARAAAHIFNRIGFAIARGVGAQIVSRLPTNFL